MITIQEHILIEEAQSNPQAFKSLYNLYFAKVYAYVAFNVSETADVEDVVSEIFIKAIKNIKQFNGDSFAAWLFSIARNTVYDFYRRSGRYLAEDLSDNHHSDEPLPESILIEAETRERILSLIRTLSPRRQEVIALKFFSGLKNYEIAEVLNIDTHSVASHLSRALNDLHKRFLVERQSLDE
jgi:RNA polymerase sigma-70 factor (ECF subfamily)